MTDEPNALGDFLRARRELVSPEQAGIPVLGARRVAAGSEAAEKLGMLASAIAPASPTYEEREAHRPRR